MMRLAVLTLAFVVAACGSDDEPGTGGRLRAADASAPRDGGTDTDTDTDTEQEEDDAGSKPDAGDPPDDPQEPEESGEATYYNAEGLGACGIQTPPDYLVAAINDEQYSKANCGRCVSVTGPKGTVVVRIIDKCPGCDSGDLDLSITAFTKIADKSAGRVKIKWRFVDCPF
ncbi:MAG: hypothetical protein J0I07_21835 [Myxococcales bacterium]|nr:hypothetical protein [Myxococcales bacterium]